MAKKAAKKRAIAKSARRKNMSGMAGLTSASDDRMQGDGERQGSPEMGVAVISGVTFASKSVVYYNVNGIAMVEGDIALGTVTDVQAATDAARDAVAADPEVAFGVGITGSRFRWPNCRMPYEIDPNLPNQSRVTDAIAHWEANTSFRFPLRTAANAGQYTNYVRFTDAGGCWSYVGMQGGQQTISLGGGCSTGNTIHEIGHAVGLWHEQSREDRDLFVTINWANIQAGMSAQFNQHISDGDDLGAYDYRSIMHYSRTAFSRNGQETITPTDPNAQIGQRNGLSPGDIGAVRAMYPLCGLKVPWADRFKKVRDDSRPFKKLRDDLIRKIPRDPKLPRDPGPIKVARDLRPVNPLVTVGLGGMVPFSLATPHHAPLQPGWMGDPGLGVDPSSAGEVERQMLELEAAIADAQLRIAHANLELGQLHDLASALAAEYGQS